MISLILPYWDRQAASDRALELIARTYSGVDLEVIVVDDGNPVPFVAPTLYAWNSFDPLNIRVVRLPTKHEPKCPATAWNAGARAAKGDVIVLSCVEILHESPVLEEMAAEVRKHKDNYVLASAWCPEEQAWHCHSSVTVPDCPPEAGIAFCAALSRELFERAGGFDDSYREGAGYEDRDWIRRLHFVGAKFIKRDDLKVIHPKSGATISWGDGKFDRNLALFRLKWPETPPITFVCLNAGNYCGRGSEYVNNLADMVKRNMPYGVRWKFVCLTDDPKGLDDNIEAVPLPDLKGWWGKLYLFKPGLFPEGTRMIFFDLDTLIVGSLAKIIRYSGEMAILRDFYQPNRGAPGVILWRAGFGSKIWTEWEAQGRPLNPAGDLGWIENLDQGRFTKDIDRLQDLFPETFVSYKVTSGIMPKKANVVCFHGLPRPHDVTTGWVPTVWKVGGLARSDLEVICNTEIGSIHDNIRSACKRDIPWIDAKPDHGMHVCIVGGGPWLPDSLLEIQAMRKFGHEIWALNNVHDWLIERGIIPDVSLVLDAREGNAEFVKNPRDDVTYYIASQCHPKVFEHLKGKKVILYHNATEGAQEVIEKESDKQTFHLLGGGTTVGMKALAIARFQGFKSFHIYGVDSCYREGKGHAYAQKLNEGDRVLDIVCEGRKFKCAPWMVSQAEEFQEISRMLVEDDCLITVAGDGLLAFLARLMTPQESYAQS